ncbi:hypothetical protein [Streptomyces sp. NPDC003023]|uniref:hypothetical protein n=1 Tax=Streptomyces sp. NPDC003023 TaxID=3364675 RepID=UPI0036BA9190
MGPIGFLAPSHGRHRRHRRDTTSGTHERLSRLLGTLAVTAAAALGPALPATALPSHPAAPAPQGTLERDTAPAPAPEYQVEMARTGGTAEQLWLLGGIALSLAAAGLVALAATRARRRDH